MNINKLLNKEMIFLDGGMGTELIKRGLKPIGPLWSASAINKNSEHIYDIHKEYFEVGSNIATTNTFRTTGHYYKKSGAEIKQAELDTILAINLAKKALADHSSQSALINNEYYIAGSITTLEDCYEPLLVPRNEILEKEHEKQILIFKQHSVDFLLFETINSVAEAEVLVKLAEKWSLNFMISFVVNEQGDLLSGEDTTSAVRATTSEYRIAILLNCVATKLIKNALANLRASFNGHVGIYPNGYGIPNKEGGWEYQEKLEDIKNFSNILKFYHKEFKLKILGGCCGTSPKYISYLINSFSR